MTTVIADADGNKVGHVIYDPFGEIVESTLAITPTDRFFTGQRWDGTIGLYDYEYLRYLSQILRPTIRPVHSTRQPGDGGNESHRLEQVRVRSQQPSNFAEIAVNYTDSTGHFIDTLWDAWDLANDFQGCFGGNDALSCYMLPFDALFLAAPGVPGVADNVARHADDAGDAARLPRWDPNVKRWRDAKGRFSKPPDVLDRSSIRWSQSKVSLDLYWPSAGERILLDEAVSRLRAGEVLDEPLLVFRKTPMMDKWRTTKHTTSDGRIYTGSFANLEDWAIYSINNRTLTALTAAQVDMVPVRWATPEEIIEFSHQYDTPNYGISVQLG